MSSCQCSTNIRRSVSRVVCLCQRPFKDKLPKVTTASWELSEGKLSWRCRRCSQGEKKHNPALKAELKRNFREKNASMEQMHFHESDFIPTEWGWMKEAEREMKSDPQHLLFRVTPPSLTAYKRSEPEKRGGFELSASHEHAKVSPREKIPEINETVKSIYLQEQFGCGMRVKHRRTSACASVVVKVARELFCLLVPPFLKKKGEERKEKQEKVLCFLLPHSKRPDRLQWLLEIHGNRGAPPQLQRGVTG
ncbi:hypothetical protein SRHO_G00302770 [Serrasalmus rhombeus]